MTTGCSRQWRRTLKGLSGGGGEGRKQQRQMARHTATVPMCLERQRLRAATRTATAAHLVPGQMVACELSEADPPGCLGAFVKASCVSELGESCVRVRDLLFLPSGCCTAGSTTRLRLPNSTFGKRWYLRISSGMVLRRRGGRCGCTSQCQTKCECGWLPDVRGRHRAACPRCGKEQSRVQVPERTLAGVCRAAGATFRFNAMLNIAVSETDHSVRSNS